MNTRQAPTHEETMDDAVRVAAARLEKFIARLARRFAEDDPEFEEDLKQEALIVLWTTDPTRFDRSDEWYLKGAIRKRMLAVARQEQRATFHGMTISIHSKVS